MKISNQDHCMPCNSIYYKVGRIQRLHLALIILCLVFTLGAIIYWRVATQVSRISDRVINNPAVVLSKNHFEALYTGIYEGKVIPKSRRSALALALLDRFETDGGIFLLDSALRRWRDHGEYTVLIFEISKRVASRTSNSDIFLLGLGAVDKAEAQKIISEHGSWRDINVKLFLSFMLLANDDTIREHRHEIMHLLEEPTISDELTPETIEEFRKIASNEVSENVKQGKKDSNELKESEE